MTIEQLDKANEVKNKIDTLEEFQRVLNAGTISCVKYELNPYSNKIESKIAHLDVCDHRNISDMIRGYVSERVTELEKQLEEL